MQNSNMEWSLGFAGIICLVVGLVGQAFEMRKIRLTTYKDEELGSVNIFMNKKNFNGMLFLGLEFCFGMQLSVCEQIYIDQL